MYLSIRPQNRCSLFLRFSLPLYSIDLMGTCLRCSLPLFSIALMCPYLQETDTTCLRSFRRCRCGRPMTCNRGIGGDEVLWVLRQTSDVMIMQIGPQSLEPRPIHLLQEHHR